MENSTVSKRTISFGLSVAVCAVLNALLVVAKEKSKTVSDWMQKVTGHHWLTHVVIMFAVFVLLGWFLAGRSSKPEAQMPARRLTNIVISGVIAGVAIILGFYLIAD